VSQKLTDSKEVAMRAGKTMVAVIAVAVTAACAGGDPTGPRGSMADAPHRDIDGYNDSSLSLAPECDAAHAAYAIAQTQVSVLYDADSDAALALLRADYQRKCTASSMYPY
jgi:hypothetical protein